MTTIAVMQPYFIPYAGYFRLFTNADLVVLYDCVQYPRRGYVHRNQLPDRAGIPHWLTLPLAKAPVATRIANLAFASDAVTRLRTQARRFPSLQKEVEPSASSWGARLLDLTMPPRDYIAGWLKFVCAELGLPFVTAWSSDLQLPEEQRGQNRILAIARHFGAKRYLNAPGGRSLYDARAFARHGIELVFLPDYRGPSWSILHRLLTEDPRILAAEIRQAS